MSQQDAQAVEALVRELDARAPQDDMEDLQVRIEAEADADILESLQFMFPGLNPETLVAARRVAANYEKPNGWSLGKIEDELTKLIPPGALNQKGDPIKPWAMHLALLMGPSIIQSRVREKYALEIHQSSVSEAEKNERIGDILFVEHKYTAHRRKVEAAKWRATYDIDVMMGSDPEELNEERGVV